MENPRCQVSDLVENEAFIFKDPLIDFEFGYHAHKPHKNRWKHRIMIVFISLTVILGLLLPMILHYQLKYSNGMTKFSSYIHKDVVIFTPMLDEIPIVEEKKVSL